MKIILALSAVVLLSLGVPRPGHSEYIENHAAWRKQPELVKLGFVMGYVDNVTNIAVSKEPYVLSTYLGNRACMAEIKPTVGMLLDALERAYERNVHLWSEPASEVLRGVIHHVCLDHVNEIRRIGGLRPTEKWKSWQ